MTWGIILYGSLGQYYSFVMADDTLYNPMKKGMHDSGMNILGGKSGISDIEIDLISDKTSNLIKKLNENKPINLEEELQNIF
ncbi:MAG: hypothetical protein NT139_01285 [Candidatus Woesearchaeota archaeon]|nr:hypothetical protein [Candidatus Woesearchaeota archaeon]